MTALLDLQRRMASAVMQPITNSDRMARRDPQGRSNAKEAKEFIKPNSRLTSFERLEIYNRQYWFRILDSFGEDFPGLRAVVGRKRFDQIARGYLTEHPSTSFTLAQPRDRGLPQWLNDHGELAGDRYALAADMLKLEWAHIEAFDAADLPPLSAEALAGLGEDPQLALQPHISLLEVRYPVDDLLLAVREHDREEEESGGNRAYPIRHWVKPSRGVAKNVSQNAETIYIAVHRADYSVCYKRLEREAYLLLTALKERTAVV